MVDPITENSGFLRVYMSIFHADTLVAFAKWFGKVTEPITTAAMTKIDSKGITLTCTLEDGCKRQIRIPVDPPFSGYDEVKPRLRVMGRVAEGKLEMMNTPRITSFRFPIYAWLSGMIVAVVLFLTYSPMENPSPLFGPTRFVHSIFGTRQVNYACYIVITAHLLESFYTFMLCQKHQTGFLVGAVYVAATMASGGPIWLDFRQRVQAARIYSVMKVKSA